MKTVSSCVAMVLAALVLPASGQELIGLRIEGPNEVVENTVTPYRVFAEFDGGREFEVTLFSDLSVDPGEYAQIDQLGDFETVDVQGDQVETIHAEFEFNQKRLQADLEVTIIDVNPAGFALDFDGRDDFVRVPRAESLRPTDQLTVEVWIKPNTVGSKNSRIVRNVGGAPGGFLLAWRQNFETRLQLRLQNRNGILAVKDTVSTEQYLGEWHHVAGVFSATDDIAQLYVDGELKASSATFGPLEYGAHDLQIGNWEPGANEDFDGQIDEVRIWNIARRAHEIRCDMHRVLRGDEEGLVGYWRFDEANGQVARDSSPYGNDGVLGTSPDPDAADPAWVRSEADLHLPPNDPPVWSDPELVPEISAAEDWSVSVAADNLSIYIASERDRFADTNIYYASRESVNEPFSTPKIVEELSILGFENHDFGPAISSNNLRIYFCRGKGRGRKDLFVAERDSPDVPWNEPVFIESLNSSDRDAEPAISFDELFIVFTSTRSGKPQLWSASRPSANDDWENVHVIEALDDFQPYGSALSRDVLTLYFAANGPQRDGYAFWKMTRSSRDVEFSNPIRVEELSSDKNEDDISITADGRTIYITRDIGGGLHGSILVSHLEGGGGCEIDCEAIRKLKAKCRENTLKVLVKSSLLEGTELTIDNDGDQRVMTIKRRGKGKLTWPDQTGIHTLQIIECPNFVKAVNCG